MKKIKFYLSAIVCFVLIMSGVSCNVSNGGNEVDPPPATWISVYSMDEFKTMRYMIDNDDSTEFEEYLQSVQGGTIDGTPMGRDDLTFFVELVDMIPYVALFDGEISWMHYSYSGWPGEEKSESFYVTSQAPNGDFAILFYELSVKDVAGTIENIKSETRRENSISSPISNQDGRTVFHVEIIEKDESSSRDIIKWYGEVDGIYMWIKYCTADASKVDTAALLSSLKITSLAPNEDK